MISIVFIIIIVGIDIFLCKEIKKILVIYKSCRKDFIDYLYETNDFETLKRIGEINMFNQEERWYPSYFSVTDWLYERYKSTKEDNYLLFMDEYEQFNKKFVFLAFLALVGLIVVLNILSALLF